MDFAFMGGSMGSVVGEKFSRACDSAIRRGVPLVSVARPAARACRRDPRADAAPKTVAASRTLHDSDAFVISVLAHPTTGGLLASFASLGDVLLAEPGR
jgi:acetyl-CoA carboxylase carboxyl transferase subunit beta